MQFAYYNKDIQTAYFQEKEAVMSANVFYQHPSPQTLLILDNLRAGHTYGTIAKRYGISRQRVGAIAKRYGLSRKQPIDTLIIPNDERNGKDTA